MKKIINKISICLILILCSSFYVGCQKEEENNDITNINIKGIYLTSSNANNSNIYNMKFLMIEVFDFENNNSYTIHNENNPTYQIKKPHAFTIEDRYLLPNEKSIISINGNQFKLIVSLTIIYNGEEINFSKNATININYTNEKLILKNAEYHNFYASLLDFNFDLSDGQKESISLILNAEEIKN